MTTRQLVPRTKEHFDPKKQSAIQNHVATCSGCADTGNCVDLFKVQKLCRNRHKTEVAEAMTINTAHVKKPKWVWQKEVPL